MRPLIGLVIESGGATPEEVLEACAEAVELFNANGPAVQLSLIETEAELAAFQAGHLVLYRKPVRRASPRDVSYRRPDGSVIKREQTTMFGDNDL